MAAMRAARAIAVATALGVVATACGSGGGAAGDETLDVWMYQDSLVVVQQGAVERFNEGSGAQAVITEVPGDSYQDKLRTSMGSGDQPDVFFNWGGGSIRSYVEADMLLPLDDMMEADPEFQESFIPSVMEAGRIDGVQYGVPMRGTQPVILFYNEELFEQVGAEPPETWEDVLALVETFTQEDITPFVLAGATAWTEQMWLQYLVDRNGGAEVFQRIQSGDPEGWRDPAVLESAQMVRDLVDSGAFGDNYGSVSYTEGAASALLAQGEGAMHLMGSWEYSTLLDQAPEFAEDGLGYVAFPAISGGEGDPANVVGNPANYFSVSADSPVEDAAVDFLKQTSSDAYVRDMIENGEVPTTTNAADLLDLSPSPDFATFQYEMVQNAPHFQLSWDQALPPSVSEGMLTEIQKLFNGQSTPEQFVDAMAGLQ
ncbi:xylobiose transport system substrate-binding protein [Spinactinospora alkalitolerans]|uniref:Xylobiose transport system substrate-binding protein n=1 Tax=Spinactinospora alkalitolerans TaxID=687207 RepID=A0A852TY75_9ACTN|nr:extracellular solute-binding protein [Spinactinospora alkalitolerans]NYE46964.1 xylobiose transport system substrate-binding protein [Spinactinospora alkalitolerans]